MQLPKNWSGTKIHKPGCVNEIVIELNVIRLTLNQVVFFSNLRVYLFQRKRFGRYTMWFFSTEIIYYKNIKLMRTPSALRLQDKIWTATSTEHSCFSKFCILFQHVKQTEHRTSSVNEETYMMWATYLHQSQNVLYGKWAIQIPRVKMLLRYLVPATYDY